VKQKFNAEYAFKLIVNCPACDREINMEIKLISGGLREKVSGRFPHVRAFLASATNIHWTWGFDEQQAEGIHQHFDKKEFKRELEILLGDDAKGE
jgi:hypothetical protein